MYFVQYLLLVIHKITVNIIIFSVYFIINYYYNILFDTNTYNCILVLKLEEVAEIVKK